MIPQENELLQKNNESVKEEQKNLVEENRESQKSRHKTNKRIDCTVRSSLI